MKIRWYQYLFIGLVLFYLLFVLLTPIDGATVRRFHANEMQIRMLGFSISVIISAVWLFAMYGSVRFKSYAESIKKSKEGPGFERIAMGLMILAISLPLNGIVTNVLRALALSNPDLAYLPSLARSYLPLIYQMISFVIISRGAAMLLDTLRPKVIKTENHWTALVLVVCACLFTWVALARPFGGTVESVYYMPTWVALITIIIPQIFVWYLGIHSAYQLYLYRKRTHGLLYRRVLSYLVSGIVTVTLVAIMLQVMVILGDKIARLNFTPTLIIVYVFIAFYAVGYGLIAWSARTLKKIEEV